MLPLSSTTTTASPSRSIKRSAVISWVLYDLANTIFSMAIVSLYYSLWLRDQVGKEQVDGLYSVVTAISMLIVFVASPLLGALTDQSRKRMPFLVVSSLICIGFTFCAWSRWPYPLACGVYYCKYKLSGRLAIL